MSMLVNKLHYPVTVLGPGRRVGLWLQGCTIHCFGCISRDTWAAKPESAVEVGDIIAWIEALPAAEIDGITISGGEPLDQPEALLELLVGLNVWRAGLNHAVDILCYSGRGWEEVQRDFKAQLALIDAIVPEPFIQGEPTEEALRGSNNQRVIALTDLGRERYSDERLADLALQRGGVQLDVDNETIWLIGIPAQGDMTKLRDAAAEAGISIKRPSWLV